MTDPPITAILLVGVVLVAWLVIALMRGADQ